MLNLLIHFAIKYILFIINSMIFKIIYLNT